MVARFVLLDNGGSPTQWDLNRYFAYIRRVRDSLPDDLRSLTAPERYYLPSASPLSFWRSDVTRFDFRPNEIQLSATNDYGTRRFEITYSEVLKLQTTTTRLYYLPTIVMQELALVRGGIFRHSVSDMRGDVTTIHCRHLSFRDHLLQ